jgi:hypothetical protein
LPESTLSANSTASPAAQLLRYGLDERLKGLIDTPALEGGALVEWLPAGASVAGYDVALALADGPGWEAAPTRLTLSLLLDVRVAPLDQPAVREVVQRAWQPNPDILSLREGWAALGHLDGPRLAVRHIDHPFAQARLSVPTLALAARPSSDLLADWQAQRAHLYLLLWSDPATRSAWEARVGAENLIDLASWPIGYRLQDGIQLMGFSPAGLPLAQRATTP